MPCENEWDVFQAEAALLHQYILYAAVLVGVAIAISVTGWPYGSAAVFFVASLFYGAARYARLGFTRTAASKLCECMDDTPTFAYSQNEGMCRELCGLFQDILDDLDDALGAAFVPMAIALGLFITAMFLPPPWVWFVMGAAAMFASLALYRLIQARNIATGLLGRRDEFARICIG